MLTMSPFYQSIVLSCLSFFFGAVRLILLPLYLFDKRSVLILIEQRAAKILNINFNSALS